MCDHKLGGTVGVASSEDKIHEGGSEGWDILGVDVPADQAC